MTGYKTLWKNVARFSISHSVFKSLPVIVQFKVKDQGKDILKTFAPFPQCFTTIVRNAKFSFFVNGVNQCKAALTFLIFNVASKVNGLKTICFELARHLPFLPLLPIDKGQNLITDIMLANHSNSSLYHKNKIPGSNDKMIEKVIFYFL